MPYHKGRRAFHIYAPPRAHTARELREVYQPRSMEFIRSTIAFLEPWDFYPGVLVLCSGALILYWRGGAQAHADRREHPARRLAFVTGVLLVYAVMQTRIDYLSQHMFFVHRIQHLVLHHLAPFLIVMSQPLERLGAGLAPAARRALARLAGTRALRLAYGAVQNAVVAPLLFVGLIALWLTPQVHFVAMLSAPLYSLMNWSMLVDGLLFWAFVLDPRAAAQGARLGFGVRLLIVLVAIPPQILIGARIALAGHDLYSVYAFCGRAWPLSARVDQEIGGLVTWIPASMMHAIAALVLLGRWARCEDSRAPAGTVLAAPESEL